MAQEDHGLYAVLREQPLEAAGEYEDRFYLGISGEEENREPGVPRETLELCSIS
jgi:hypothetical protein